MADASSLLKKSVLVIGAGASGLIMIKALKDAGVAEIVGFEKSRTAGGVWWD